MNAYVFLYTFIFFRVTTIYVYQLIIYEPNMDREQLLNVLARWKDAKHEDVQKVKELMMPEDDISTILFKVRDHPSFFEDDDAWYEVNVRTINGDFVCKIYVDIHHMEYVWE
jgi:hypothetical protein